MQLEIELPEDIGEELRAKWKDLPRHALEALTVEDYRSGALNEFQVRRMLGLQTRLEVNRFLHDHGICYDYGQAEIEEKIKTGERLLERRNK
jgi:uncharacterized protein UPF0175